jgi:cytochrome P450
MVLSHELVTNVVLNPQNPANQVMENGMGPSGQPEPRQSLLFQLGAYRPEMTNLTRHYILCDDDIKRHDAEKAYQHLHGIKASDAGLVANICRTAADELVAKAMAKGGDTIDIVQDVARWIPMKVVNSYFGVPCGDAAPEFQLENSAVPLFQGLSYQKGGVHHIKVSEETMYMWIANGFRSLFLNVGKDPELRDAGRRSGAQLMYYLYLNVRAAANKPLQETMLSRLAHKMKDPSNPYLLGTKSGNTKVLDQLKPIAKLEDDGAENALFGLCTDVVAYRTAAQLAGSVAGAGVTIEEAIARVFNVLLSPSNKEHLDACIAIAKSGGNFRDYYSKLFPYYNEALRFQPQAELLPRTVAKKAKAKLFARKGLTPKPGFTTNEEVEIPGGTLTLTCIYAAMHDKTVVESPEVFKIGRPGNQYLHFGWSHPGNDDHEPKYEGQAGRPVSSQGNACLGRFIAPVEIIEAMRAVLVQAGAGIGYADDAKLSFQKYGPMRPGDSTFNLTNYAFDRSNPEDLKSGPGAYPAGLRVRLK